MHPKWRCVFHIQPEREPCSGEGHDHHRKKRRTVGWICKSIAEATNLALGRNPKESARTEQVAFAATGATAFNASDDGWLRSIFHPPATRVRHASSDVRRSTFNRPRAGHVSSSVLLARLTFPAHGSSGVSP